MTSSESKNITIRSIIKSMHNKPSNFSKCDDKIITSASGVWKILKIKPSNLGPGG